MTDSAEAITVLYADDDGELSDLVASFLEREHDRMAVRTAASAAEAREMLDDDVDCVVSDYDMPGENGIEFLESVRETRPDLPFVLYTGKGSEEVASDAIAAGVTDYLQKDSGTEQYAILANRIRNAVEAYRAEREAEETRAQFRAISDHSADAIVIVDADSRIRFANPAVEELFGYEPAELRGASLTRVIPERHREDHLAAFDRYLETGERSLEWSNVEFTGLHRNGTEVPLSVSFGDFHQDGETRFVGIMRDLSEQTRLDAELRERERELAQYKRALDEAPVGVTLSDPRRADNPLVYANDRFEEMTGYAESAVLGRNCRFLQGEETDPDAVAAMREAIDREERVTVEVLNYREDGSEFWNQVSIAPVHGDDGDVVNYVGFQQDVTDSRRHERVLREMYEIISDRGKSFEVQVRELLELGRAELDTAYGTLSEIRGDEYVFEVVAADDDSIRSGDVVPLSATNCELAASTEQTLVLGDIERDAPEETERAGFTEWGISCYLGAPVYADREVYGTFCFYDTEPRSGQFSDWEVTFVDLMSRWVSYELTRRQTNERLAAKNERLEQFASIVSHDLRNPLNVAQGRLELVREERDSEDLRAIGRAHERMAALISDLLTLARENTSATELTAVDLGELVNACWANVETTEATIVVDVDGVIRADESRLRQLFENLIRNSVEHGGPDVTVTIGGLDDGFYVEDDGPGLPAGERESVFEAGYSTSSEGTGFGLSIVAQVVEAHGWEIGATDGAEGGARFEITGVEFVEA